MLTGLASMAEDTEGSWNEGLAVAVPSIARPPTCPDRDQDGYPDAWTCQDLPADRADCDDSDPNVGPDTERFVRPGPFIMGSASAHAGTDEQPVHVVQLSGYCLDRTAVSRAAFHGKPAGGAPEDRRPVERVSWNDALAWCRSRGKTLPTEAQWEKAARGGCEFGEREDACDPGDLRAYPWGNDPPTCERANHRCTIGTPRLCVGHASPVDEPLNVGPYGHVQLAGNVWEWVLDTYHPHVYRTDPPRVDPTGPEGGDIHVLRGGAWNTFSTNMRNANRMNGLLEGSITGIRCARSRVRGQPDPVSPLVLVPLTGEVISATGLLSGRALYVTAFEAQLADPATGRVSPGQSPVAEVKLDPSGQERQRFVLEVPAGGTYFLMASLDAGKEPAAEGGWEPPSSTGGVGHADQNPVPVAGPVTGITIKLGAGPGLETAPLRLDRLPPAIPGDPAGVLPAAGSVWSAPFVLAPLPAGGHRPQVAVGETGRVHVVYYRRQGGADVVMYRSAEPGGTFGPEERVSVADGRNWGPDLVIGPDGQPWVSYDHAGPRGGQVHVTRRTDRGWATPEQVSVATGRETSSAHLAFGPDGTLVVVWLSQDPGGRGVSRVLERRRTRDGTWAPITTHHEGSDGPLHPNIAGGPDGWLVTGFDYLVRRDYRQVHLRLSRDGNWGPLLPVGDPDLSTERPNFVVGPAGLAFAAWTDTYEGDRVGVSYATRFLYDVDRPWSSTLRLTRGIPGRHYDPDVAADSSGHVVLVWAWQTPETSTILYSEWQGKRFSTPKQAFTGGAMVSLPSIAAGPDGRFHLVWNQGTPDETEVRCSSGVAQVDPG